MSLSFWSIGGKVITNAQGRLVLCTKCPCPPSPPVGTGTTADIVWFNVDGGPCGPLCVPSQITLVVPGDPVLGFGVGTWTLEYVPGFAGNSPCKNSQFTWVATQSFPGGNCLSTVKWTVCVPGIPPIWNSFSLVSTDVTCLSTNGSDPPGCTTFVQPNLYSYTPFFTAGFSFPCALRCSRVGDLTLIPDINGSDWGGHCLLNSQNSNTGQPYIILPSPN